MAWGDYNRYIAGGLGSIADVLRKKWDDEYGQQQYAGAQQKFLFEPGKSLLPPVQDTGNETMPSRLPVPQSPLQRTYQYERQRENPFDQSNVGNLLNFLRQPGGQEAIQMMLATQPKEQFITPSMNENLMRVTTRPGMPAQLRMEREGQFKPPTQQGQNLSFMTETLEEGGKPIAYSFGRDPITGQVKSRERLGDAYYRPPTMPGYMNPDKLSIDLLNRFNANEQVKRAQQMASNANIANDILEKRNPIGDEAIKVFMARAAGEVGNLAQTEQERYGGSRALLERIQQVVNTAKSGTLTDDNRKFMQSLAQSFKKGGKDVLKRMAKDYSSQYSQNPLYGMDTERMYRYLIPQSARGEDEGTDKFTVGKTYKDAGGRVAKYLGNGKWESK